MYVDGIFLRSQDTARGDAVHRVADLPARRGRRLRAVDLWSDALGLIGKADVVELDAHGRPTPVEYKSGARRGWLHEAIQVCAQGLCLEEMTGLTVPVGYIYYATSSTRRRVAFDASLRARTVASIAEVRALIEEHRLPAPVADRRCKRCSLEPVCLPYLIRGAR